MKTITATVPNISGLEIEYLLKIGAYRTEGEVLKDALRQFLLSRPGYRIDISVKLYTDGKISLGKAAELAGISFDEMKDALMQMASNLNSVSFRYMKHWMKWMC